MLFHRLHVIGGNGSSRMETLQKWRLLAVHCDLVAKQPPRAGLHPVSIRFCRECQSNPFIGALGKHHYGSKHKGYKGFFHYRWFIKAFRICMQLHMWPLSALQVSLKIFHLITDPIISFLCLSNAFFKVLRSEMIIPNLFFTLAVNLKFLAAFVWLSISTQHNSNLLLRESGPRLTFAVVVDDKASVCHAGKSVPHRPWL